MAQTDHTHITTVTLSSSSTTITFSNFSGYTDLLCIGTVWHNGNSNTAQSMYLQLYNSSGWNQSYNNSVYFRADPTSVSGAYHGNNNPGIEIGYCSDFRNAWGNNNTAGWGPCVIGIGNYADTDQAPHVWYQSTAIGYQKNTSSAGRKGAYGAGSIGTSHGSRTSEITQFRLYATSDAFHTGTSFNLYGINYS